MLGRWRDRCAADNPTATPCYSPVSPPPAAALARVNPSAGVDGVNMLPVLQGKSMPARQLYWEQERMDNKNRRLVPGTLAQAVRHGEWKAIRHKPETPLELYNLAQDPSEKSNVAAANPRVVAKLEEWLKTARVAARPHNNGNDEWVGRKDIPGEH